MRIFHISVGFHSVCPQTEIYITRIILMMFAWHVSNEFVFEQCMYIFSISHNNRLFLFCTALARFPLRFLSLCIVCCWLIRCQLFIVLAQTRLERKMKKKTFLQYYKVSPFDNLLITSASHRILITQYILRNFVYIYHQVVFCDYKLKFNNCQDTPNGKWKVIKSN